jgi:GNAT superfamily N-acetyltransferase
VMPTAPEQPAMNAVLYQRAGALGAGLDELAATYDEAGVNAWMVWVPAADRQARRLLKRADHRLTSGNMAMAGDPRPIERPPRAALKEWTAGGDPEVMAAICDRAFVFGAAFAQTYSHLPRNRARAYLASLNGEPVSCVLTTDHDGNCMVDAVATVPEARGRGLAAALLAHALADASERGCATTTLVASPMAQRGYERLGYRALCPLEQWERRRRATPS